MPNPTFIRRESPPPESMFRCPVVLYLHTDGRYYRCSESEFKRMEREAIEKHKEKRHVVA